MATDRRGTTPEHTRPQAGGPGRTLPVLDLPPIRQAGQIRPGGTGRLDLQAAALHPLPVVRRAMDQAGRDPGDVPAGVRPGMNPGELERLLLRLLPHQSARVIPPVPHPTTLPLSRAFRPGPRAGTLVPAYPAAWTRELLRLIRARDAHTCQHCGIRTGDLYAHTPWNKRTHAPDPLCVMVQGVMSVAHADSDPANLEGLRSLCSLCHNRADRTHTRAQKALSLAWTGQLTEAALDYVMTSVILPATREAPRPLGALQPGGADLVTAVLADRGQPLRWSAALDLVPALAREAPTDITRVLEAGVWRLQLRGLMDQEARLTRQLTVAWPADGTYPPPRSLPPRQHRHTHTVAPRPKPRARASRPAVQKEEVPIIW